MADIYFEGLWDEVVKEIKEVFASDKRFLRTKVYPERDRAYNLLQNNYIRYVNIINKLGECYSQIIHPQERILIKTMLDCSVGRLLEIKSELVEFEKTDFIYMDHNLIQMKKTILDLDVTVPEYYRTDRIDKLNSIDSVIAKALSDKAEREAHIGFATPGEESSDDEEEEAEEPRRIVDEKSKKKESDDRISKRPKFKVVEISEEQKEYMKAVRLLQRHERARIGRLKVQLALEHRRLMDDIAWLRHKPIPEDVKLKVAKIIQRYWNRYQMRRHQTHLTIQRNVILGLLVPSWRPGNELRKTVEELGANRRKAQAEALQAMEDAAITAKIRMEKNSDKICDSIAEELRYWIETWYRGMEVAGFPQLPAFPDAKPIMPPASILGAPKDAPENLVEKFVHNVVNTIAGRTMEPIGGSALIVAGLWIPVDMYALLVDKMQKVKAAPKTDKPKPDKKELKEKLKKEKEQEAKKLADLKKEGFVPTPSKFTEIMNVSVQDYTIDWESRSISRKHDQTLIDLEIAKNLHLELRQKVDEDMRLELERLQAAIDMERKGGVVEVKRKEKEKKAKKKKGKKDLTGKMSEEELIANMAMNGMISSYRRQFFIDLPGCQSLGNFEARYKFFEDPPPQWGDFKQVAKEYCVLHLGSSFTHLKAPLVRSVLICGPQQILQDYADVICTESGAVRFVLDPMAMPLTAYKKKMFDHLFAKVPRLLKPAIILIPGAEKIFYKNVPKQEKAFNPKALNKVIPKMVKTIKPGDQILILGLSDQPWASTANQMVKAFDKVLCFPDTDFQTLDRFWSDRILKYHGVDRYFNTGAITKMTQGYNMNELEAKMGQVMNTDRLISLKYKPLQESEFCLDLKPLDPKAEPQNSWDWCQKSVKIYAQRQEQLAKDAERRNKENKKEKKKEDKKKQPKKKEPVEKEIIDNNLLSRAISRPVSGCGPWAPERLKDSYREYYGLFDSNEIKFKHDLYRDEKSLEQFPIRKPNI